MEIGLSEQPTGVAQPVIQLEITKVLLETQCTSNVR